MKRIVVISFCLCLLFAGQAQVSKTINIVAGTLQGSFTSSENKTITNLKVTGTLNASDFFFVRDSLSVIQILDLSEARITSPLDTIPDQAFFKKSTLRKISFPANLVRIGYAAFYYCSGLLSVEVPATVTSIGASAFSGCGVKSVILPPTKISYYGPAFYGCDSLVIATTPCSNDGGDIFSSCNNLRTIIVPEGVTTIRDGAFYQLTSMTTIKLPTTITSIGTHAFYNCINLDSITIPEGVTSIGQGAFWQNMKLKSVKIPNSLTTIEDAAFSSCSLLTSLVFPKGLTTIKRDVFGGCSGLTTITIPYGNDISYGYNVFGGCSKLKTIIIPDGITSIKNYAFNGCPANVTTFKIPASVKSIGDQAFASCTGIDLISIPDSVTSIGAYAFSGCSGLKSVSIPNAVTNLRTYAFQNCSNLSSITLPATLSGINEGVFSGCTKLTSVSFPTSITSLGKAAFSGCTTLVLTSIPGTVTSIGESCFSGCQSLKSIVIPSSISAINTTAFAGCIGLTSIQFSNSNITIGYQAFLGCNGLTSITLPTYSTITYNAFQDCKGLVLATTPYAYNSGNIFAGCVNLKTILVPSGLTAIRDYAFYNCNTLDSINLPTSLNTIGNNAFNGCSNLKRISLPKYLNLIGDYGLANCSNLTSISLPALLHVISNYCFSRCTGLTSVTIPVSVNTINSYAFDGCTGLNSIFVDNSFPLDLTKYSLVFNSVNKTSCILNVPYGTKARYLAANQWSDFTNIVEKSTGIFVSSNKAELSANPGSTITVDVKANVAWTASSNQSWVSVTPTSGTGDNTLTFTADNTQITTVRNAVVTVSAPGFISQTVVVYQKLAPKTVSISAGGLSAALTANELSSLSTLIVTGTMDARDFKTMRDSMPQLTDLDLTGVSIAAYTGVNGTYTNSITYTANVFPVYAFYNGNTGIGKIILKTIKLPSTITSIGSNAFGGCSGLTTPISIPSSVVSISSYAFYNCTGLSSITIPTSVSTIGSYAFYNCTALTSIIVNSSYPIDLTSPTYVFYNINKTTCSLYVPYGSKSLYAALTQWKDFANIVENATGFILSTNKLKLPYNAGSSVNVDLKSNVAWTVSSDQPWLTVNPGSGSGNSTLLVTAETNTTSNTRKAIITVSAPDCISQIVEVTQNIAPKTIDITAGGLSTALTTDEFSSLSSLTLTGTMDARDFKTLRDKMPLLTDLDFTGTSILAYTGTDGTYPSSISTIYPANTIPQYAFYGKVSLTSALIPSSVTSIGSSVFQSCSSLTSFIIPSTINSIGTYAFYGCTGLTSIYSNSSYPIDLSNSYSMFYNVNKTTCTLYVPYKAKALYTAAYQWNAFTNMVESTQGFMVGSNKIKLAYAKGSTGSIDISANVSWTVASDQPWLSFSPTSGSGNGKLTFIADQNDSTTRRYANVILSSAGYGSQIITVTQTGFPKTINIIAGGLSTSLTSTELSSTANLIITGTMDARDFKTMRDNMPELAYLDISGTTISAYTGAEGTWMYSSTYAANAIPTNAFYNSNNSVAKTSLISVKLPPNVISIDYSAFKGCTSLISFTIPSTVTSISYYAFQGCSSLASIYANSISPIDLTNSNMVFDAVDKTNCTIYVPYATKGLYAVANQWKDFTKILESAQGFLVGQKTVKFSSSVKSKSVSIAVKANVTWKAQSNQPWLVASSNDSILTLVAEPNPSDSIRKATIIVSSPGFDPQTVDVTQAAAPRKVTAGGLSTLLTSAELSTISDLALMGTVDARDFKTMRDNMPALANLDLAGVNIVSYSGTAGTLRSGTYTNYPDNEMPQQAFYMTSHIKSVILPESAISLGSFSLGITPNLSSVILSNQLKFIGSSTFVNCSALTTLSLPDSLISIGDGAFSGSGLSGQLYFPSTLKRIGASAFNNCNTLKGALTIPATIDSIGSNAFYNCSGFTSLVIYSANIFIGTYAFSSCYNLKSVTLPTTLTTIGDGVFSGSWNLKSISFPSVLHTIGKEAFRSTGLTFVDFPATLSSIGESAFSYSGLITLTIPSTLTNIGDNAFSGCTSLNSVSFPATLKKITNGMFSGCTSLNPITFPTGLETIGDNAFNGCSAMTNINLPVSVTSLGSYAFTACTGLNSINFPSSLITIGNGAFYKCTGLISIDIPASVTTINYQAFSGCSGLISVKLPPALQLINNNVFESCQSLASIIIPATVKSIGNYAFYNCKSLTSITIPSLVETLGENSFYNCTGLTKIDLPLGLKSINTSAFGCCAGITSIDIPSTVLTIGDRVFEECTALRTVKLSENLQTIGYYGFYDCINLSNIALPNTLKSMGGSSFMNCSSLKSIVIPPLITDIGDFINCTNLTSVTLNSGLKSISGFTRCGFSTITLPSTLTDIGYMAFSGCNNLTSITIPQNVKKIGNNAFSSCANLKSVNIPASVNDIEVGAFGYCTGLTSIYAYPTTPVDMSFSGDGFYGVNKTTCILYVPLARKTAYKNTLYWQDFSNIIEMPTAVPTLLDSKISIYPNTIRESFSLNGLTEPARVILIDMSGKQYVNRQVGVGEIVQVGDLPKGLYIILIITSEGRIERKIIKN